MDSRRRCFCISERRRGSSRVGYVASYRFVRGVQYAIALGLLDKGEVVAGVLGCPNLPLASIASRVSTYSSKPIGCLFSQWKLRRRSVGWETRSCVDVRAIWAMVSECPPEPFFRIFIAIIGDLRLAMASGVLSSLTFAKEVWVNIKAMKRVDVHNVVSLLKLCCAFEVDLRLAMEWVVLCAHCLSISEALLSIWGGCVVFLCTIFENLEVRWLNRSFASWLLCPWRK